MIQQYLPQNLPQKSTIHVGKYAVRPMVYTSHLRFFWQVNLPQGNGVMTDLVGWTTHRPFRVGDNVELQCFDRDLG